MSYTPNIIIDHTQLCKQRDRLEKIENGCIIGTPAQRAYRALLRAMDYEPMTFGKLKLVLTGPDFSTENRIVRETLDDLKVTYQTCD